MPSIKFTLPPALTRTPVLVAAAVGVAIATVAGVALLGGAGSTCSSSMDPKASNAAFLDAGVACFLETRTEKGGLMMSRDVADINTSGQKSWQITQDASGVAVVVAAGTGAPGDPGTEAHLITGTTDYVSVSQHQARAWLTQNKPTALWVSYAAPDAAWQAGLFDQLVKTITPAVTAWSGRDGANNDGTKILTGQIEPSKVKDLAAFGSTVSVDFYRDKTGALTQIVISGDKKVAIYRLQMYKSTIIPEIKSETVVDAKVIPASAIPDTPVKDTEPTPTPTATVEPVTDAAASPESTPTASTTETAKATASPSATPTKSAKPTSSASPTKSAKP